MPSSPNTSRMSSKSEASSNSPLRPSSHPVCRDLSSRRQWTLPYKLVYLYTRPFCRRGMSRDREFEVPVLHLVEASSTLSILHQPENIVGVHDQVFFPLDLYLRASIFGQDHHVPCAHLHLVAVGDSDDLGSLRLLPSCVREYDPASRLLFTFEPLNERPRPKRLQLHLLTSCMALIGRHKVTLGLGTINKMAASPSPAITQTGSS